MLIGEVHTGLFRSSYAMSPSAAAEALALKPGTLVLHGERPVRFAMSPETLCGVDCVLGRGKSGPRAIGTISSRATIIDGQVLQSSSHVQVVKAKVQKRSPWSHYLANPGVVETIGRQQIELLKEEFLDTSSRPSSLDFGATNARLVKAVQKSQSKDARPAFRTQPTRVRWVAYPATTEWKATFGTRHGFRSIEICAEMGPAPEIVALCEDIALHDWLLTTIIGLIDQSKIGVAPRSEVVGRLMPALDCLLHLWMPGARLTDAARSIWTSLEERVGFSRQWNASVNRVRDQVSLAAISRSLAK